MECDSSILWATRSHLLSVHLVDSRIDAKNMPAAAPDEDVRVTF